MTAPAEPLLVDLIASAVKDDDRIMGTIEDFVGQRLRALAKLNDFRQDEPDPAGTILDEAIVQTAEVIARKLLAHGVFVMPGGFKPGQRVTIGPTVNLGGEILAPVDVLVRLDDGQKPLHLPPSALTLVDDQAANA
ncbi:Hypothetical protein AJAP_42925 (plasmid) [Amycolatopsis japonica]|uniref:Uncharacterized protein n=1 Tax=Amycolatopsis japonica TaxID=208439 RepID=A0A075V4R3_9PSEU|nr:hypothetical protein [Amycolatopsis japonica]AIG81352.1 Hypothetical protein AJAP_42925 [Amycolatopsis japonica]